MKIDRIEKGIEKWEVWFPPEGSLVLCDGEGHPSVFEIDGRLFMFLWSATQPCPSRWGPASTAQGPLGLVRRTRTSKKAARWCVKSTASRHHRQPPLRLKRDTAGCTAPEKDETPADKARNPKHQSPVGLTCWAFCF